MSITEIVLLIAGFLFGVSLLYFTAYLKVKRKNRELQEYVSSLEDENRKIASTGLPTKENYETLRSRLRKFESVSIRNQWEIAPTKADKPSVVNIEKRECSFAEKRQQYLKYVTLLDEFHRKINAIFTLQFHPIMNRFLESNSVVDQTVRSSALHEFNREVQNLFKQLYEEQSKVSFETNNIRSFSSDKLDELLGSVEAAVRQSTIDALKC